MFEAYHGVTGAQHQANFDRLASQGFRMISLSVYGDPADPYKFELVRTSPNCAPRAKLVDAAKARPSEAGGWKFNDLVRVPSAQCPTRFAVVRVWRKPANVAPPALDAQGKARLYLEQERQRAAAGQLASVPEYAVSTAVEGTPCAQ